MTEAKLLEKRPISGAYPEKWFDAHGQCTSVLFENDEYKKWLGVFGNSGIFDYNAVIPFSTTASALVVAKGQGYIVDINSKELCYKTECNYIRHAVHIPSQDLIIAHDSIMLYAFSSQNQLWQDCISSDDIELDIITDEFIHGKAWQFTKWQSFTLYLDSFKVELGDFLDD